MVPQAVSEVGFSGRKIADAGVTGQAKRRILPLTQTVRHEAKMNEKAPPERFDSPLDRITTDPSICHGQPCIRGLRYPVDTILDLLSSGMTTPDILKDYEDLEVEDVRAVLAFAARLSRIKSVQALAS